MRRVSTSGSPERVSVPERIAVFDTSDGEREVAYDRTSPIGRLAKALDEAHAKGWTVVSMKGDRTTVFPQGR